NSAGVGCMPCTVSSERQEVAVELLVALPPEPFVEALRGVIVGGCLQHQSIGLGAFGELPCAIHQGKAHALFASLWNHVKVAENPLSREVQRGEDWIEVHKPLGALFMLGIEEHGFAFA